MLDASESNLSLLGHSRLTEFLHNLKGNVTMVSFENNMVWMISNCLQGFFSVNL